MKRSRALGIGAAFPLLHGKNGADGTVQGLFRLAGIPVVGCAGFARADQCLTPDGRLVFNEVNSVPGSTEHSRFPTMLQAAGP